MWILETRKYLYLMDGNKAVERIAWDWSTAHQESRLDEPDILSSWFVIHGKMNWHRSLDKDMSEFDMSAFENKPEVKVRYQGVLLEVGHGPTNAIDPGALHPSGATEFDHNWIAAKAAKEYLDSVGVPCDITDTKASLYTIGRERWNYDLFVSIHHNAFNRKAQYALAMVHKSKQDSADKELGKLVAAEMAKANDIRNAGVADWTNLGVLSGAEDVEKDPRYQASVLAECYFIDSATGDLREMSDRAGRGIGVACRKYLKDKNR